MGDRTKTVNQFIGGRIKALREAAGLTQAELGKKVNKGESTVRMWELGKSEPDLDTTIKLAEVFDVTTDFLLGKETLSDTKQLNIKLHDKLLSENIVIPPELQQYQFAFFEGIDGLSDESVKDILKYVDYVKAKENQEKK